MNVTAKGRWFCYSAQLYNQWLKLNLAPGDGSVVKKKSNSVTQNNVCLIKIINDLTTTEVHISFLLHRVELTDNVVLHQIRAGCRKSSCWFFLFCFTWLRPNLMAMLQCHVFRSLRKDIPLHPTYNVNHLYIYIIIKLQYTCKHTHTSTHLKVCRQNKTHDWDTLSYSHT